MGSRLGSGVCVSKASILHKSVRVDGHAVGKL